MSENEYKCNDCGFVNHASCRFCIQCGKELSDEASTDSPGPAVAMPEDRTVAILRKITEDLKYHHEEVKSGWRIKGENTRFRKKVQETHVAESGKVHHAWVERRPIPSEELWFENVWADFRKGSIYR